MGEGGKTKKKFDKWRHLVLKVLSTALLYEGGISIRGRAVVPTVALVGRLL